MTLEWTRLVWAILCLCVDHTIGQRSPCPNVFQYEYDGYEWYGLITPQNFPVEATNQLKVELSLEAELPSNYVGSLGLSQSSEVSVQKIEANEPFSYILRFPIQSTLPEVIQITINGETICSGSQGGLYASKMTLTHKLFYSAFTTRYYTVYLRNRYEATTTLPAIYLRNQDDNAISSRQYVAKTTQVPIYSLSERSGVESTCADIFKYQFEGGEWIGLIEPQSFIAGPTIKLEIKLSLSAVLPSKYVGTLRTLESLETTIEKIKRNQPFSYKITFPTQSPLPKVTKITINEQTMCSGLPESSPYFSSIGLSYTIYSDLQIAQFSNSNSIRLRYESPTTMRSITRTTSPTFTRPFTTTTKRTTTTTKRTTTTTKPTTTTTKRTTTTTKRTTTTTKPTTTTIKPTTTTTLPTTTTTLPTTTITLPTTTTTLPTTTITLPTTTTTLPTTTTTLPTTTTTLPTTTTTLPTTTITNSITTSQATKTVQPAYSNPECGIVDLDTLDMTFLRIINPKETVKGQYPFLAALFELTDSGREFFCGGTLITTNHVLTAAHCIQPKFNPQKRKNADDILLLLGKYNLMGEEKSDIRSPVEKIHVNPSWDVDNERYDGDLAILSLSITVSFSKYVRPVCLPNINENINRMRGLIAGWGLLDNNNTPATTLKHAGISVDTDCFFEDGELSRIASKRTFCGKGDGAPNEGDSGGGFFARSNGKWTQYGIISTVRTDKHRAVITGAFSVYTNVMDFIDWIDQTIN